MPYKRKDGAVWWVSFTDPSGKRIRRSTGTNNRKEAEALEAKWKLEAFRVKQWDAQPSRSFEELMVAYLKATRNEKRTRLKDRGRARNLRRFLKGRAMNELSPKDVRAYIALRKSEGKKNSTINRELSLLSAAINYANREWDWELPNPIQGRKLKEGEGRARWLTQQEADALIRAAGIESTARHLPDFIRLALHTGCRSGELLWLEWKRVDLSGGLFYLEGQHTKTGKRRSIPLNQNARRVLVNRARFRAEHCPTSPWVFCNKKGERIGLVRRSFMTACERAGIEDFRIHDLRHCCAAWLVSAGVPLTEVRDLLGHSTVRMTERYAHLAPENVRAAVARLDNMSRFGHGQQTDSKEGAAKSFVSN